MKLRQLFEMPVVGMQDDDVPPPVKRDFRRLLLELVERFHGKFEPIGYPEDGGTKHTMYYMGAKDEHENEVIVNLLTPDDEDSHWTVEVTLDNNHLDAPKAFTKAKHMELKMHLIKKFGAYLVNDYADMHGSGSFTVKLPFSK